jgi:hypothetical protein
MRAGALHIAIHQLQTAAHRQCTADHPKQQRCSVKFVSPKPCVLLLVLLLQGARRSTAPSGGGAAASGAGARARRSVEGEELAAAGEGLALQSPDLLPHFVIDVSAFPCQTGSECNKAKPECLLGAVVFLLLAGSACISYPMESAASNMISACTDAFRTAVHNPQAGSACVSARSLMWARRNCSVV